MKNKLKVSIFSLFIMLAISCQNIQYDTIFIKVKNIEINPDGIIEQNEWNNVDSIYNFSSPWKLTVQDYTVFKCFNSELYFNFYFNVIDDTPIYINSDEEIAVAEGDRVELFFSQYPDLRKYYCMEIAPDGNVLDYMAEFYRKFDYSWNFNLYTVTSKITPRGYVVEGRISLTELETLGINFKEGFYLGVFRADFTDYNENSAIWYSWLNPNTKEPDFHIPSAFGKCKEK